MVDMTLDGYRKRDARFDLHCSSQEFIPLWRVKRTYRRAPKLFSEYTLTRAMCSRPSEYQYESAIRISSSM